MSNGSAHVSEQEYRQLMLQNQKELLTLMEVVRAESAEGMKKVSRQTQKMEQYVRQAEASDDPLADAVHPEWVFQTDWGEYDSARALPPEEHVGRFMNHNVFGIVGDLIPGPLGYATSEATVSYELPNPPDTSGGGGNGNGNADYRTEVKNTLKEFEKKIKDNTAAIDAVSRMAGPVYADHVGEPRGGSDNRNVEVIEDYDGTSDQETETAVRSEEYSHLTDTPRELADFPLREEEPAEPDLTEYDVHLDTGEGPDEYEIG